MKSSGITCADTDEGHLEARYAAGALPDDEAEAFEAHFFACDRCWMLVQRAIEVRAVESRAAKGSVASAQTTAGIRPLGAPRRRDFGAARWLALAAGITLLAVGTWRVDAWRQPAPQTVAMRGPTDSLHVVTQTRGTTLIATWVRATEASSYRVRLYSASGTVLHQREVTDTTVSLAAASLPQTAPGAAMFWEIQAMNRMRQVIARSGLREVRFPRLGK